LLRVAREKQFRLVPFLGAFLVGDLLWFAYGRNVQCDPALYFPPVPALSSLAKATPGRVIGHGCLYPALSAVCGLQDVRGYDAVDPARLVELVSSAADRSSIKHDYAVTMQLPPTAFINP